MRSKDRDDRVGEFFAAHEGKLRRVVGRKINAPHALIEDACANAWAILLRRPDITLDEAGLKWLITVAINEALRLLHRTRGETPVGTFQRDPRDHTTDDAYAPADTDMPGADERALERIEHAERVDAFRELKPREREALYLKALGYSYREIARLTDSTYTAVNRRISEGRTVLRGGRPNTSPTNPKPAARGARAAGEDPDGGGGGQETRTGRLPGS